MATEPQTPSGRALRDALFDEGEWPDEPAACIIAIEREAGDARVLAALDRLATAVSEVELVAIGEGMTPLQKAEWNRATMLDLIERAKEQENRA